MTRRKKPIDIASEADEQVVQRQIAADPDDHDATDADLARAKPFADAFPDLAASIKRVRGRPPAEDRKVHVSLRLSSDVLAKFKASGKGWQARINRALEMAAMKDLG